MIGLTRRQRDCLLAIDDLTAQAGGVAPTVRMIARDLGHASHNTAQRAMHELRKAGMIRRLPRRARAVEITPRGHAYIDALCEGYEFSVSPAVEWVAE